MRIYPEQAFSIIQFRLKWTARVGAFAAFNKMAFWRNRDPETANPMSSRQYEISADAFLTNILNGCVHLVSRNIIKSGAGNNLSACTGEVTAGSASDE